jgi:hypothetical protein
MMKSFTLVVCLIAGLLLQSGCKIALKRKSDPGAATQSSEMSRAAEKDSKSSKDKKTARVFTQRDTKLIALYYSNEGNAQVLDDIVKQTSVSSEVQDKLKINQIIPNGVQVVPLPLELEKMLSPLSGYDLRVQVGKRVMIMDIKSRRILDVIKLK